MGARWRGDATALRREAAAATKGRRRGLGGAEREGACETLSLSLLPLLIGSRGGAEEARRGEAWGSIVPTPHVLRLLSLKRRNKTASRRRAAPVGHGRSVPGPRLVSGGPGPAAASRRARALAGFPCHVARVMACGQLADRPAFPPTRNGAFRRRRAQAKPAPQDRKLTELFVLLLASKLDQLRGLLSE